MGKEMESSDAAQARQRKNLHLSARKTSWAKRKITYQAAFNFNLVSPEIQETESILLFEMKLKRAH